MSLSIIYLTLILYMYIKINFTVSWYVYKYIFLSYLHICDTLLMF